jgi:predicted nucleic acid-binding protein
VTLVDAGPLIALINRNDPDHERCVAQLPQLPRSPLVTTWPCLAEAMYLLHRVAGHAGQDELWGYVADGLVDIHASSNAERGRMRILMAQYADSPMDLGDASLVAAAETLGVRSVFTLDQHFHAYRLVDRSALDVVP